MPYLALLMAAVLLWVNPVLANDADQVERAQVAVNMFKKVCFSMMNQPEERVAFLDKNFVRHDAPEKKQNFLNFTSTKEGDVWIAKFPKGVFAIVVAKNHNCHILAQKADRPTVRTMITAMAEEGKKALPHVTFKPVAANDDSDVIDSAGFEVVDPDGKVAVVVLASTPKQQADNKPDAIITLAVSK